MRRLMTTIAEQKLLRSKKSGLAVQELEAKVLQRDSYVELITTDDHPQ